MNNYHTHTTFCDGKDSPESLVQEAIRLGCAEIGFSGHSHLAEDESSMSEEGTLAYCREIRRLKEEYREDIKIYLGIEHDIFSKIDRDHFEYVIGAVHYVQKDGKMYSVDWTPERFQQAVDEAYDGDCYAFIEDYYRLVGEVWEKTHCDIIAHFDLVMKFNENKSFFDPEHPRYLRAASDAMDRLLSASPRPLLEINTGAISRGYRKNPYPEQRWIEKWREAGGQLILSSDCHDKKYLLCSFERLQQYPTRKTLFDIKPDMGCRIDCNCNSETDAAADRIKSRKSNEILKKNTEMRTVIESATAEGYGISRIQGRAVFIPGTLPGETWDIRILKVTSSAVWAKGLRRYNDSSYRITNDCPNPCGGCCLRHMQYEEELRLKKEHVNNCLRRIGKLQELVDIIHPSPVENGPPEAVLPIPLRYRNKAVFAVSEVDGKACFGFYRPRSHSLIPVQDCLLQSECCIRAARAVTDFMNENNIPAYREENGTGIIRHLFWRETAENAILCIVAAKGVGDKTNALIKYLRDKCPELTGIVLNINKSKGNTVLAGEFHTLWGDPVVMETLGDVRCGFSPQAFLQVNRDQADAIYRRVLLYTQEGTEPGATVLDLYCGTGTIGLSLAKAGFTVTGIEIVPEAVENAKKNAENNGITNATFYCGDAGSLHNFGEPGCFDTVVVDPPRKGLAETLIHEIASLEPRKLIYVSCNPATLARDLNKLRESGFSVHSAEAYDMFPRTAHVETVCLLIHN